MGQTDRHDVSTQRYAASLQQYHGDVVVKFVTLAKLLVNVVVLDVGFNFRALFDLYDNIGGIILFWTFKSLKKGGGGGIFLTSVL